MHQCDIETVIHCTEIWHFLSAQHQYVAASFCVHLVCLYTKAGAKPVCVLLVLYLDMSVYKSLCFTCMWMSESFLRHLEWYGAQKMLTHWPSTLKNCKRTRLVCLQFCWPTSLVRLTFLCALAAYAKKLPKITTLSALKNFRHASLTP
jgi:hypothetical protein